MWPFSKKELCDVCARRFKSSEAVFGGFRRFCSEACRQEWSPQRGRRASGDREQLTREVIDLLLGVRSSLAATVGAAPDPDVWLRGTTPSFGDIAAGEFFEPQGADPRQQTRLEMESAISKLDQIIPLLNALDLEAEAEELEAGGPALSQLGVDLGWAMSDKTRKRRAEGIEPTFGRVQGLLDRLGYEPPKAPRDWSKEP